MQTPPSSPPPTPGSPPSSPGTAGTGKPKADKTATRKVQTDQKADQKKKSRSPSTPAQPPRDELERKPPAKSAARKGDPAAGLAPPTVQSATQPPKAVKAPVQLPPHPAPNAEQNDAIRQWAAKAIDAVATQEQGRQKLAQNATELLQRVQWSPDPAATLRQVLERLRGLIGIAPLSQVPAAATGQTSQQARMETVPRPGDITGFTASITRAVLEAGDHQNGKAWRDLADHHNADRGEKDGIVHLGRELGNKTLNAIRGLKVANKSMAQADGVRIDCENRDPEVTRYRIQAGPSTNGGFQLPTGVPFAPNELRRLVEAALNAAKNNQYVAMSRPGG